MHANSLILFRDYAAKHFTHSSRVLEVGCTEQRIQALHSVWHTADIDVRFNPTFVCAQYHIPTEDTYDIVYSANTLEHVRKPWVWMQELCRLCTPVGKVILIAPANWPYHEDPIDCWRIYADGMRALMEDAGLSVITSLSRVGELEGEGERAWFPNGGTTVDTIGVGVRRDNRRVCR